MGAEDFDRSKLAYVSGVGFMAIILFYVFFMGERSDVFIHSLILLIMGALMVFCFLFDELWFMVNAALKSDDAESYQTKVKRGSNFFSGILLMGIAGIILIIFMDYGIMDGIHLMVLTFLSAFSVFLLLYSMFLGTE